MNNNPFLKSKEVNNRFNFLKDEDDIDISRKLFKEHSTKPKRNEYEPSQNSFSKSQTNRDRTYNKMHSNSNKPKEDLPNIDYIDTNITTFQPSSKYKEVLINIIQDDTINKNLIPPGWTEITLVNGNSVFNHGPPTLRQQKLEKQKEIEKQLENNPNYLILKVVDRLKQNWDLNEKIYNSINGEGAYAERFRLPPVYGSNYDIIEEEEEVEYDDEYDV